MPMPSVSTSIINGPTKCSSSEPDILLTDSWNFTNANATLEFAFPVLSTGKLPFIVKSLTETSMTIEIYLDNIQEDRRQLPIYSVVLHEINVPFQSYHCISLNPLLHEALLPICPYTHLLPVWF